MKKNMTLSVIARVVTLITGLIVQREILLAYGSSFNGLTSSITQVMSYLVLLEAGLGTASIQALYSPLANDDWGKISGIVSATDKEYKKISAVFTTSLLFISLVLPFVVADEVPFKIASLLTFITGGSYVLSYIVGGKYKAVLNADRKIYILYLLDIITISLSCVGRIIALRAGFSIVVVQAINLATVGIKNIGYVLYVRKKYNLINYKSKPDMLAIGKRWSVLIHNIAGIVVNHTDVLILTLFANLKLVSIYSVYNMVFGQLSTAIQATFMQAPQANFGRLYNEKEEDRFFLFYRNYEYGFSLLLFFLTTVSLIMILPFVRVYTAGVTDINYIDLMLPILFALILLMNQIRSPAIILINIAGTFKETQRGAIIEAVINLSVSLVLFFFTNLGVRGLLIGTVCSYAYRTVDVIVFSYTNILKKSIVDFTKVVLVNFTTMSILFVLFYICFPIRVENFIQWIVWAIIMSIITLLAFMISNMFLCRNEFSAIINNIKEMIWKNGSIN